MDLQESERLYRIRADSCSSEICTLQPNEPPRPLLTLVNQLVGHDTRAVPDIECLPGHAVSDKPARTGCPNNAEPITIQDSQSLKSQGRNQSGWPARQLLSRAVLDNHVRTGPENLPKIVC